MVTSAFTVAMSDSAISAEKVPATCGPNRLEAASEPTASTPFMDSSGVE